VTAEREHRLLGFIRALTADDAPDAAIASVAEALANSGARLSDGGPHSADFASTGGPTSLSTLVVPLFLSALGRCVPTLAVPGRPAGGVDVLASVPGYVTDLDVDQVEHALREAGHAHFAAGSTWAPDDAALFDLRQRVGAQAQPTLVIASIIAKKLAVGARRVGLEVRVGTHGNFGATVADAQANAARFCRVARMVGLDPLCILTDASQPYQPFVGRGEALIALAEILSLDAVGCLAAHAELCRDMALVVSAEDVPADVLHRARDVFERTLRAQGSGLDSFRARVAFVRSRPRADVLADADGVVSFNLDLMREALVSHQKETGLPDGAGIVIRQETGTAVSRGDVLFSLRCEGSRLISKRTRELVARCVQLGATPPRRFKSIVVDGRSPARLLTSA
jgi:thymidine phosphorylase